MKEKNRDDEFTKLNTIRVDVESPKLIIDEYLVGEKVLNRKRPMFLLLDMGRWRFKNASSVKKMDEMQSFMDEYCHQFNRPSLNVPQAVYNTLEMSFLRMRIFYSHRSCQDLLGQD